MTSSQTLDVGGLGLPDRDYYLKPDKRFADARAGYLVHVARMLRLPDGRSGERGLRASQRRHDLLRPALAKASLDNVASLRDPHGEPITSRALTTSRR